MDLFFDTETTGLPIDRYASVTKLSNWPHLVQLAYQLYDRKGNLVSERNHIIRPSGFVIPEAASDIHGITYQKALEVGVPLKVVLEEFNDHVRQASGLVAHNMEFDAKVVGASFLRCEMKNPIQLKHRTCTMMQTTDFCKIPRPYSDRPDDYKWPSLQELHTKLFGCGFDKAHDALVDIQATAKCFWELRKQKIL